MKKLLFAVSGSILITGGVYAKNNTPVKAEPVKSTKVKTSPVIDPHKPEVAQIDTRMGLGGMVMMHVKLGQHVKKGQLLFNIDTDTFETARMKAENELDYRKKLYQRDQKLLKTHSISLEDYQTAKYNYINAVVALKNALIDIKDCYYYAPFDGVVTKILNYDGSGAGDGNEVIDITRTTEKDQHPKIVADPASP